MWKKATQIPLLRRHASEEDLSVYSLPFKKNRKVINKFIKKIGRQAKLDLALDPYGFCYIPFKKFLIIIGVPDDDSGLVHFQTMVFDLQSSEGVTKAHKRVAAANLTDVRLGRKGAALLMESNEINLVLTAPIKGMKFAEMIDYLDDFMQTAVDTNANLESIS